MKKRAKEESADVPTVTYLKTTREAKKRDLIFNALGYHPWLKQDDRDNPLSHEEDKLYEIVHGARCWGNVKGILFIIGLYLLGKLFAGSILCMLP